MRLVIQRVNHAQVSVNGIITGKIGQGYLVLLGIAENDTKEMVVRYVEKMAKLRIFPDENGKTNLSIQDVNGKVLVVSQFTLYADCRKGNRPSFTKAAKPQQAEELYEYFLECVKNRFGEVQHGVFGAYMKVQSENDGPFTVIWDSSEW